MLKDLNYLIYSSHKTATQSLLRIFQVNHLKSIHCHFIDHLSHINKELEGVSFQRLKEYFLECLFQYKKINHTKLKIITIIRNPIERLPSSFFQSLHSDEIMFLKKKEEDTTVMKLNDTELHNLYIDKIINNKLLGGGESIDEMNLIFNVDIIKNLKKSKGYYFFENNLIKLYVLDFNKLISENNLGYLNEVLGLNLKINGSANLSKNKTYYQKYQKLKKKIISDNLKAIIVSRYKKFYFNAFD